MQTALSIFHRALEIFQELEDRSSIAGTLGNIGNLHGEIGNYAMAIEHYERSLEQYEELDKRTGVARITGNLGMMYDETGDYPRALDQLHLARSLYAQLGERSGMARSIGNIGNTMSAGLLTGNIASSLLRFDRVDKAESFLEQQALLSMTDPRVRATHYGNRAHAAIQRNELDGAHDYLNNALSIVVLSGNLDEAAAFHLRLRDVAQQRNDFTSYIEHNNEYQRSSQQIHGKEATQKLAMMESQKSIDAKRTGKEKHLAVLYTTLPPSIADRVLKGEEVNDSFDTAAVMFTDIVGFSTMSATRSANDVVRLLSGIFSACDAIIAEYGIMKIKTIGDSYMSVAFDGNVTRNAGRAARKMISMMSIQFPHISVRTGIHCGPDAVGVIGTERLQYDGWRDTVNVASRMESSGSPGRIQVSETFAMHLQQNTNVVDVALLSTLRGVIDVRILMHFYSSFLKITGFTTNACVVALRHS